jgi:hypothetical protein
MDSSDWSNGIRTIVSIPDPTLSLKRLWCHRLKNHDRVYDEQPSNSTFRFSLRRYTMVTNTALKFCTPHLEQIQDELETWSKAGAYTPPLFSST